MESQWCALFYFNGVLSTSHGPITVHKIANEVLTYAMMELDNDGPITDPKIANEVLTYAMTEFDN
eukprot:11139487-Karenia_brevis.AAC.1